MDVLVYGLLTKEIKETIGASYVSSISSSDTNNVYLDVTYKKDDASTEVVRLTFPKPLNGVNGLSIVSASFVGNDMVFTRSDSSTLVIVGAKTLLTPNIESKQDALVSGNNIKTINGNSILGSGDLVISGGGAVDLSDYYKKTETYSKVEVDTKIADIPPTDLSGYYNKTEVNNIIDSIPATDLSNYYDKTETYSKVETNSLVATKQDTLVSGTSIKTINGQSVLGSGNLSLLTSINPSITGSITEQVYNLTGTEINPTNGTIQYKTVSANTTFTETLTSGQSVLLRLINANSYTITFPAITWVGAVTPTLTANCAIVLWKEQSTLYGAYVGSLV